MPNWNFIDPSRFLQKIFRNSRQLLGGLAVGTVAILWLLWLSRPFLLLGPIGYVRANEFGDAIYPQVAYIARVLRAGQFSLWLPSQAGGTDLLGNFNSPLLNVFLYVTLPTWLGNDLIFLIVTAVASISTYVLLRRSFNCAAWAACIGAGAYSTWFLYGGLVFAYNAGLCLALAPLLLHRLLSVRGWSVRDLTLSAVLGFVFSCGGHFTWSIFILGTVFFCALLLATGRLSSWLPHLSVMCLITVAVQLPFVLANMQTASFSARAYYGSYYQVGNFRSMLDYYILSNPSPAPYFQVLLAASGLAALAVLLAPSRWTMAKQAWPVWGLSALFVLLPVIDIAVIYLLSVLRIGGFALAPDGVFGGPIDIRLRHGRPFIACVAIALAADLFWKAGQIKVSKEIVSIKWRRRVLTVRFEAFDSLVRTLRREIGWVKWRGGVLTVRLGTFHFLSRMVVVTVVVVLAARTMIEWANSTRLDIGAMRAMAVDGVNFSSFYAHPDLRALAAANPAFDTYRVATVQLYGPDSDFSGPPRDPSLFAGFQNAYGFEAADAYMSNLTQRSMNFWNLLITGHPDFPRTEFDAIYRRKFAHADQAFSQKLYLFEPLDSKMVDKDGCIRTQTPIDFSANYNLDMLSLDNVAFIVSGIPLRDSRLTLLDSPTREDLRALQCVPHFDRQQAFRQHGLMGRPLYVYRNQGVFPRVFAPRSVEAVADEAAMYRVLPSRSSQEFANTALVVESEVPARVAAAPKDLQVDIKQVETVRGDHLKIATHSETGGLIVVTDSFSPYWRASAGGAALPVFPTYHTFIGIWVPPGDRVIELQYRPPYAKWLGYGRGVE
jgi:hypothetical protein